MRPQRIVVGEVRQQECLDLLIALNSGIPGMCTVHANSAREAVTKMCTLPLLARGATNGGEGRVQERATMVVTRLGVGAGVGLSHDSHWRLNDAGPGHFVPPAMLTLATALL